MAHNYSKLQDVPFHALQPKNSHPLHMVMEADQNNPEAAAYAKKFNEWAEKVENGEDVEPELPAAAFDPGAIRLVLKNDKGIPSHPDRMVRNLENRIRNQLRRGEDVGADMSHAWHRFKDAYAQAMQMAPDHFVPTLQGREYVVMSTKEGSLVVNGDNPAAVAWAEEIRKHIKPDGTIDPNQMPKQTVSNSECEIRPPPGASPEQVKETNALNTMMHRGIESLSNQYHAGNQHAPATPAANAAVPGMHG